MYCQAELLRTPPSSFSHLVNETHVPMTDYVRSHFVNSLDLIGSSGLTEKSKSGSCSEDYPSLSLYAAILRSAVLISRVRKWPSDPLWDVGHQAKQASTNGVTGRTGGA